MTSPRHHASAYYLDLGINWKHPVKIEPVVQESTTFAASISTYTTGTDAVAMRWTFNVMPDDMHGVDNVGGILLAHKFANRRRPFAWPGRCVQPLGHITALADKTITTDAVKGSKKVRLANATDLRVGRVVQMPDPSRVYMITAITPTNALNGVAGATDISIEPALRVAVAANDKMKSTPVPQVKYDPELMDYTLIYSNRQPSTKVVLREA